MQRNIRTIEILGSRFHLVQIPEVLEIMSDWIEKEPRKCHQIVVTGMHGVMEGYKDKEFQKILNSADLFVPDGISLVWTAKILGYPLKERVTGTDLMKEFFKIAEKRGYKSFFFGDTKETLKLLRDKLKKAFPNLKIVGFYSPPFRSLTEKENKEIIKMINEKEPDVLWVALGLPKQEKWIFVHKEELKVPVVAGVGAAFKFLSERVKRAPDWVGKHGFEWLWRFFQEPKRLWRRTFFDVPKFVLLMTKELIKKKWKGVLKTEPF